jgi:hypothetical protein
MSRKSVKTTRKDRNEVPMSAAMQAAMFKVGNVGAGMSTQEDEATQQAARKTIADTIEE